MHKKYPFLATLLLLSGLVTSHSVSAEEPPVQSTINESTTVPAGAVVASGESATDVEEEAMPASVTESPAPASQGSAYTENGADTCIRCHDEEDEYPVFDIFKTKHGQRGDKRTPFAGRQCEACHGPGAEHAKRVPSGQKQAPIIGFGAGSKVSSEEQNKFCLACHRGNNHIGWKGSMHESADVACANCHSIHAPHDPVLAKRTQPDVCYKCHKKERAAFFKPSTHPVRAGLMSCSECHTPHGSGADNLLAKSTVNQTCYTCHAEKRGPFLWEHAPVTEDCTICHNPHGSVYGALLKKSPPLLCQQCHAPSGHPAVALTGTSLINGGNPSGYAFLLAGGCINCHSQVHGSNHPSGVRQMR